MSVRRARRAAAAPTAFSSPWLATRLQQLIGPLRKARLCVAYSGGADSTALLAAAAALRSRCELRALHVNHQLQEGADAWARAARKAASQLRVGCTVLVAPVRAGPGESLEATARTVRYSALRGALRPGEWLLLAQHQDDQLETLLLQLLRGAGVAGLAAMPAFAPPLLRPLLDQTRAGLQAYARRRGLSWCEDPSNQDERFDRNYLRHEVLPALLARWPSAGVTIGRSAALAAEAQQLLAGQADLQLQAARDGQALQVAVLRRLAPAARRNALRRWLEGRGLPMPDQRRLLEIAGPLLRARHDAQPLVQWPGGLVRRHGSLLHAFASGGAGAGGSDGARAAQAFGVSGGTSARLRWHWLEQPRLPLPGGASLELLHDPHGNLLLAALPATVEVAFRAGGERLVARHGGLALKRLLQQRRVPTWQRSAVPLLYAHERLIAVADWWCEPGLQARQPGASTAVKVTGTSGMPAKVARGRLRWCAPI